MGLAVEGEIPSGEWWKINRIAAQRVFGYNRWIAVATVLAMLAVFYALYFSLDQTEWGYEHPVLTLVLSVGVAIALELAIIRRWRRRLARRLLDRGEPAARVVKFSIESKGLKHETPLDEGIMFWPAFTELVPTPVYWILVVQRSAHVVPRRLFASVEVEKAFISAIWDHLSEAARARSPKAAAYLAAA